MAGYALVFSLGVIKVQKTNNMYSACDWWHGVPQLFWNYVEYNYSIPSSCAEVNLVPVPVS